MADYQEPRAMRALLFQPMGGLEQLRYTKSHPVPTAEQLEAGEVLIKVSAAGLIHPELLWPTMKTEDGRSPLRIPCPDYAGTIAAVAADVSEFRVGDEVMAVSNPINGQADFERHSGGAAELTIAKVDSVMPKPTNTPLRLAASIPLCAWTAWQAFHEQSEGKVKPGVEVLITGAGGPTGLWAVQIAKLMGARVAVTASDPVSIAQLQKLGADEIINYRQAKLEDSGRRFDVVLDGVGGDTFRQCAQVVKKKAEGGLLISLVEYQAAEQVPDDIVAKFFIWRPEKGQMSEIVALIEQGRLHPVMDSFFPLEKGLEAYKYAQEGHCHGKVVLVINP